MDCDSPDIQVVGNTISNNKGSGTFSLGVGVILFKGADRALVQGNDIEGNSGAGVRVSTPTPER